jgi:hypothetical protein
VYRVDDRLELTPFARISHADVATFMHEGGTPSSLTDRRLREQHRSARFPHVPAEVGLGLRVLAFVQHPLAGRL